MTRRHGLFTHAFLLLILSFGLGIAGCDGKDGAPGSDGLDGLDGADGADGADGQACWDLNGNGIGDLPDEDLNNDGVVDVRDCNALTGGAYEIEQLHAGFFTDNTYDGTESCLNCHGKLADEVLTTAHFTWKGLASNIVNVPPGSYHGKVDLLNNFCIAVPSNEGRCTQCHAGYGWVDQTFDPEDPKNIDCLVCHDQTNTYAKAKPNGGLPEGTVDLQAVARSVAMNGGKPTIDNCIDCHAKAGGGNNVKHGDIAMNLANTTMEFDVHMGTDTVAQYVCVDCHDVKRDANLKPVSHGIGGMPYHSVDEGNMKDCVDCHGAAEARHAAYPVAGIINTHPRLACQVCHIPTIARHTPTKMEWYWDTAGDVDRGKEFDPDFLPMEIPVYDPMKGSFVWKKDVRPTLLYFDGTWNRSIIGVTDEYTAAGTPADPVVLGAPASDYTDDDAMIYPFKKMIGNQIANTTTKMIMVPHLFGTAGGANPYWGNWDWSLAVQDAAALTGQPYDPANDTLGFVSTEMYLTVNHEVAPREDAYGVCQDCHGAGQIDWTALGYSCEGDGCDPDPAADGDRPPAR
ncbi:MAG: hypothetical protein KJP17_11735 [Gammaproteobacteria bacterium]|nr:hypothetical protein [Gammaproteobacteria bacterium]